MNSSPERPFPGALTARLGEGATAGVVVRRETGRTGIPTDGATPDAAALDDGRHDDGRGSLLSSTFKESLSRGFGALRARHAGVRRPRRSLLHAPPRRTRGAPAAASPPAARGARTASPPASTTSAPRSQREHVRRRAGRRDVAHVRALRRGPHGARRREARRDGRRAVGRPQRVRERRLPARDGRVARRSRRSSSARPAARRSARRPSASSTTRSPGTRTSSPSGRRAGRSAPSRRSRAGVVGEVTGFWNDIRDLIQYDAQTFSNANVGHARTRGVEVAVRTAVGEKAFLRASYTYLDAQDLDADEPLIRRPRHRASLTGGLGLRAGGSWSVTGIFTGARPDRDAADFTTVVESPSYLRVDAALTLPPARLVALAVGSRHEHLRPRVRRGERLPGAGATISRRRRSFPSEKESRRAKVLKRRA